MFTFRTYVMATLAHFYGHANRTKPFHTSNTHYCIRRWGSTYAHGHGGEAEVSRCRWKRSRGRGRGRGHDADSEASRSHWKRGAGDEDRRRCRPVCRHPGPGMRFARRSTGSKLFMIYFVDNRRAGREMGRMDDMSQNPCYRGHFKSHQDFEVHKVMTSYNYNGGYLNHHLNPITRSLTSTNPDPDSSEDDHYSWHHHNNPHHGRSSSRFLNHHPIVSSMAINPVSVMYQKRTFATVAKDDQSVGFVTRDLDNSWTPISVKSDKTESTSIEIPNTEELAESFVQPLDFHNPAQQLNLFKELEQNGKFNEMLATFQFLMNTGVVPSLEIYNMTLRSIVLRTNTGETLEESLTHLLNVYSNMLNSSVKPDASTYNSVITALLEGSLKAAFQLKNPAQGLEYFQVGKQLFQVCDHTNLSFDKRFYELYLTCSCVFNDTVTNIHELKELMAHKLGDKNAIFYLSFMRLTQDYTDFLDIYNQFKERALHDEALCGHQFDAYQLYIGRLIHSQNIDEATLLLDQIMSAVKDEEWMHDNASGLISTYLEALSYYDLGKTHELFTKFDSIPWLPEVEISSLLTIINNCLQRQDFALLTKFWNYSVIRKDFNSLLAVVPVEAYDLKRLIMNPGVNNEMIIATVIEQSLYLAPTLNPIRFIKESMLKDIRLSSEVVVKVLQYMIQTDQPVNFITNFIISQGHKHQNANEFLSAIVDVMPKETHYILVQSAFFKKCCESYRLISDNFYGIYKNLVTTWDSKDTELLPKLKLYYSVIYNEMNDIDNYYVEMPEELKTFKAMLAAKMDDLGLQGTISTLSAD